MLVRGLLLWGLWAWSGGWGPAWLRLVPWGLWLWRGLGMGWPRLRQQAVWGWVAAGLWQAQRLALLGYLGVALSQQRTAGPAPWCMGLGCVVCQQDEPRVVVARQADGSYQATLSGHFTLAVAGDHPFRLRLLVLFLSLLDVPGLERGSRRTREGRTPFVRQWQLAAWFGVPQPDISRWLKYWQTADWANLLSLHSAEVLTAELVGRIVEVCATFPTWGVERVYHYLRQQGLAVTEPQVQQAITQSGWRQLQQTLAERDDLSGAVLRLREDWLVGHPWHAAPGALRTAKQASVGDAGGQRRRPGASRRPNRQTGGPPHRPAGGPDRRGCGPPRTRPAALSHLHPGAGLHPCRRETVGRRQ